MVFTSALVDEKMVELLNFTKNNTFPNEVPIGAFLLDVDNKVIAATTNRVEAENDSTAHAEMLCLRQAEQILQTKYLTDCTIMITVEPCLMCAGAIKAAGVKRVIFGAFEPKMGAVGSVGDVFRELPFSKNKTVEIISGIRAAEAAVLLSSFFKPKR